MPPSVVQGLVWRCDDTCTRLNVPEQTMRITPYGRLPISLNPHNVIRRSAFQRVYFTTGCTLHALRRPRPAPVRINGQPKTPVRKPEQDKVTGISFWPTELLQNANSGGGLSLRWNEAIHFLTQFRDLQPSPGSEPMKRLCSGISVHSPNNLLN